MTNNVESHFSIGYLASQSGDIGDDNARTEPTEAEIGRMAGILGITLISLVASLIVLPDLWTVFCWLRSQLQQVYEG